jgi:tetratricopeptide (TPR) repeat protein
VTGATVSPGFTTPPFPTQHGVLASNGNVTFDAASTFRVETRGPDVASGKLDQLRITGSGTITFGNAHLDVRIHSGFSSIVNSAFVIVKNESSAPRNDTKFTLPDGTVLNQNDTFQVPDTLGNKITFQISYLGLDGTGKDVVLFHHNTATTAEDLVVTPEVVEEAATVSLTGHLTDPDPLDILTLVVDWGDGTAVEEYADLGREPFLVTHQYRNNPSGKPSGEYTIHASWRDDQGAGNGRDLLVTVNNVAPTVFAGFDNSLAAGDALVRTGYFSEPGDDAWTATIDYGDGSGVQPLDLGAGRTFELNHVYNTVARAVHYAHQRGLLHRDLKPANILLDAQGQPHVTDFGLAKRVEGDSNLTQSGMIVGTPSDMAPEQAAGRKGTITTATDVYGLGAVLYELLTGRPPFRAETPLGTLLQVKEQEPARPRSFRPQVDHDLETICLKCLEKDPAKRYASTEALAEDLDRWLAGEPIHARRNSIWERMVKFGKRRPAVAMLIGISSLAGLGLIFGSVWHHTRLEEEVAKAQAKEAEAQAKEAEALHYQATAEQQRRWADARFLDALDAVDTMLTRAAIEHLISVGEMDEERRQLLEDALRFYKKLLQAKGSTDPDMRRATASAYRRTAGLYQFLGQEGQAEEANRRAIALQEELVADFPDAREYKVDAAISYGALGTLYVHLQRPVEAETALLQGQARWEQAGLDFKVPAEQSNLAGFYHQLGSLYRNTHRFAEAEAALLKALSYAEPLVRDYPEVAIYQNQLAGCNTELGNIYAKTDRPAEAEAALLKALDLLERLARRYPKVPDYKRARALCYTSLGLLYRQTDRMVEAESAYRQGLTLTEELARDHPKVPLNKQDLAHGHYSRASLFFRGLAQTAEAEADYLKALSLWEDLAAEHPNVPAYRQQLAATHTYLGLLYKRIKRPVQAEAALKKSLILKEQLARDYPKVLEHAVALGGTQCNLGNLARETGNPQEALEWYGRAIVTLEAAFQSEPGHAKARQFSQNAHWGRAQTWTQLGRYADAASDWSRVITLDDGKNPLPYRVFRARNLVLQGDHAGATAEVAKIVGQARPTAATLYTLASVYALASVAVRDDNNRPPADRERLSVHYAAQAVEMLEKVRASGYFKVPANSEKLRTDPEFDPLRLRDDFKKLLSDGQREVKS